MKFKFLYILLSVLLGAVFIISGLTKLFPVQLFELALVDGYFSTWSLAPFSSRFIIGVEIAIGVLLILNIYFKKRLLLITLLALILFSIHLAILYFTQGDVGNCMCFGNTIKMGPLESIGKNIVLFLLAFLLYKKHDGFAFKYYKVVSISLIVIAISLPFVLNPIPQKSYDFKTDDIASKTLDINILYNNTDVVTPKIDLTKGKHIVAFISLTCPHCRIAAYKFYVLKKSNPDLPIFMVLNGDDSDLQDFFEETKSEVIPHTILLGREFVIRSGLSLPSIFLIENDTIVQHPKYVDLTQDGIETWLNN